MLAFKEILLYNPFVVTALGFRQMVRHWILIPAFQGSSPCSPVYIDRRHINMFPIFFYAHGRERKNTAKAVHARRVDREKSALCPIGKRA